MEVGDQCHDPATLPPGKIQYPLYRRLGGPQVCLDGAESMYVNDWFKPLLPLTLTSLPHKVPYAHC